MKNDKEVKIEGLYKFLYVLIMSMILGVFGFLLDNTVHYISFPIFWFLGWVMRSIWIARFS